MTITADAKIMKERTSIVQFAKIVLFFCQLLHPDHCADLIERYSPQGMTSHVPKKYGHLTSQRPTDTSRDAQMQSHGRQQILHGSRISENVVHVSHLLPIHSVPLPRKRSGSASLERSKFRRVGPQTARESALISALLKVKSDGHWRPRDCLNQHTEAG